LKIFESQSAMCLIAMAWGMNADYPLVIAANRDEFYARPTAPLAWWTTASGQRILGGRDLKDGGTWMGFAPNGRFAMLTNVREPTAQAPAPARSRGELVVDWLGSRSSADAWCAQRVMHEYAGFNLILGDWVAQTCYYLTHYQAHRTAHSNASEREVPHNTAFSQRNRPLAQENNAQAATNNIANNHPQVLQSGQIWGLSNAALNTPWPKTQQLKAAVHQAVHNPASLERLQTGLAQALQDKLVASDAQLPHTGLPLAQERALSAAFVRYPADAPVYGTRSSLCVVAHQGQLHLLETTHEAAQNSAQARATLPWPKPVQ
jgi:uncharacterized protein with NRDE domain